MYKTSGRSDRKPSARTAGGSNEHAHKSTNGASRKKTGGSFKGGKTWGKADGRTSNGSPWKKSENTSDRKKFGDKKRSSTFSRERVNVSDSRLGGKTSDRTAQGKSRGTSWNKTGSATDDHGQKRYSGSSQSRGTRSARPYTRTADDRGGRSYGKDASAKKTYTTKRVASRADVSEYSNIIADIRDDRSDRGSSERGQRAGYKKSYDKKPTAFRSSRGKSPQRSTGRGRRKKSVYDHNVFIKEATAQNESTKPYIVKNHFVDFALHPRLQKNIDERGYVDPTPIQDQAIPYALTGRDVIGIANTGTGKTAAFLLPLIHKICNDPQQQVLILAPTRELALQIDEECQQFTKGMSIRTLVCIGGTSMQKQLHNARQNVQIIIGTPGRTKDLMQRKVLNLSRVNNVVLDEMDRMLDMGFINDITLLLSKVSVQRQSLFFSATMDNNISKLVMNYLTKPVTVEIASRPTSENVHQDVIFVQDGDDKLQKLHTVLKKKECDKVLVFSRTKMGAKKLAHKLHQSGMRADAIHGDMSQGQRQRTLASFRENRLRVLVATDVVARGIDIDGISHVINYDLPENYEDYIHRIGRTGRGSSIGYALTFFER